MIIEIGKDRGELGAEIPEAPGEGWSMGLSRVPTRFFLLLRPLARILSHFKRFRGQIFPNCPGTRRESGA
ncbi:MAG: hypothetical protein ACLQVN_11105 [Bryobacteraceae bacterium]